LQSSATFVKIQILQSGLLGTHCKTKLHNSLIENGGVVFGMTSKAKANSFWRKPEQYQSQHQNSETKPENISVNSRNRFIIGKDAIAAAVYSPTPFNFNKSI
jgi:hypothetical protein